MPVTYPGGGPRITVEALLKQPRLIARALTNLTSKRFVADRIFARGTSEQVAGGVALYQRSESIYADRDPSEVGVRAEYPRAGWSEALFAAAVKKYGLEVPITDEQRRRNQLDTVARGQRKLANSLVKFVDTLAMTLLLTDTDVISDTASGDWSTAATDIIADLADARRQIQALEEGYEPDTLIVNPAQELDLLTDTDIRNALPRESGATTVQTGRLMPLMGFSQILSTPQMTAGTIMVLESTVVGTIADEAPGGEEGYQSYAPGGNYANVYVKTYREENSDETIVRGARFPAMWLAEPKAAIKLTGA